MDQLFAHSVLDVGARAAEATASFVPRKAKRDDEAAKKAAKAVKAKNRKRKGRNRTTTPKLESYCKADEPTATAPASQSTCASDAYPTSSIRPSL